MSACVCVLEFGPVQKKSKALKTMHKSFYYTVCQQRSRRQWQKAKKRKIVSEKVKRAARLRWSSPSDDVMKVTGDLAN